MKLQPFGAVDHRGFPTGEVSGSGGPAAEGLLEIEVGLDEGGFGESRFRRGQGIQVAPGAGHCQGASQAAMPVQALVAVSQWARMSARGRRPTWPRAVSRESISPGS